MKTQTQNTNTGEKVINFIAGGFITLIGTGTASAIIYTFYIVLT